MLDAPKAQGSLGEGYCTCRGQALLYVRRTRTSLGRAARTAHRGTPQGGTSERDHLEGALRRVSPPTTDGFYSDPWSQTHYGPDGRETGGSMGVRLSERSKPVCAYEWRLTLSLTLTLP